MVEVFFAVATICLLPWALTALWAMRGVILAAIAAVAAFSAGVCWFNVPSLLEAATVFATVAVCAAGGAWLIFDNRKWV